MSTYSYMVAWFWYLGAVVGMILVWWRATRSLPALWRDLLRALPAAWALTPWTVEAGHAFLAPAWLVMLFEGLLREGGDISRAGAGLVLGTAVALLLVGIEAWRRRRMDAPVPVVRRKGAARNVTERKEPRIS